MSIKGLEVEPADEGPINVRDEYHGDREIRELKAALAAEKEAHAVANEALELSVNRLGDALCVIEGLKDKIEHLEDLAAHADLPDGDSGSMLAGRRS
jgi:hypothetical protein